LHPRFAGSNPSESDGFLRAIKIRDTTSFGWEVKLSVVNIAGYFVGKIHGHFSPSLSYSLLGVSADICQTAVVDKSGMIRPQMGGTVGQ
jgi:hypothetical protein